MDRKAYLAAYKKRYRQAVRAVTLSIDAGVFRHVEKLARAEGKKPSALLAELALCNLAGQTYVPADVRQQLQRIEFLIRNVANNLNQIAHYTNTVKKAADHHVVFEELLKLRQAVDAYTKARLADRAGPPPGTNADDHQIHEP